jgi:hypothetical protein
MVIAMGVAISRGKNEFSKINTEPAKLEEFRPSSFKPYYSDDSDDFWNEQDKEAKPKKKEEANEFSEF